MADGFKLEIDQITINPEALTQDEFSKFAQRELANTLVRLRQNVQGRGVDANGTPLKPYSAKYKEAISKGLVRSFPGLVRKTRPDVTSLTVSGDLWRSAKVVDIPEGGELSFHGAHTGSVITLTNKRGQKTKQLKILRTTKKAIKQGRASLIPGSLSNAALAKTLHDKGFTNWFQFGREDLTRIQKNFVDLLQQKLKTIIEITKKV